MSEPEVLVPLHIFLWDLVQRRMQCVIGMIDTVMKISQSTSLPILSIWWVSTKSTVTLIENSPHYITLQGEVVVMVVTML